MWLGHICISTEVVSSPNDTTVFPNQSAVFPCEVNGVYTFWRVNGTPSNEFPYEIRSDLVTKQGSVGDNELYTLTIPGKDEYNETRVQCVTGRDGVEVESETVTLRVQGTCTVMYILACISRPSIYIYIIPLLICQLSACINYRHAKVECADNLKCTCADNMYVVLIFE